MAGFIRSNIKQLAKKQSLNAPTNDITLNVGEALYSPSPKVIKAIQEAAATVNHYPDNLALQLREAIAEYVGVVNQSQIIVGNGSDALIELILKLVLDQEGEILLPVPTYYVYDLSAHILGGRTKYIQRREDFGLDVPALLSAVTPSTRAIFLTNPNNPTGNLSTREEIEEVVNKVDCWVVVDEVYYEFGGVSVVDLLQRYDNLLILRSFSKGFGLAGLRVGFCLGSEAVIERMNAADQIFPVNHLGQVAALAALKDIPFMKSQVQHLKERRALLAKGISALGLRVFPSDANFILVNWADIGGPQIALVDELAKRGIHVADYSNRPGLGDCYARITIGDEKTNQTVLSTIEAIIEGKGCLPAAVSSMRT